MNDFQTSLDIANRALDHCGQDPIGQAGFNEASKKARLAKRLYDKLRRAELQRRNWSFATVEVILRAMDPNTAKIEPTVYSFTTTYYVGSIVSSGGALWMSNRRNNQGFEPQVTDAWDQYFGPLTASFYDSKTSYSAGEIVFTAVGDGTYRVYLSKVNGNTDDPSVPTQWNDFTGYYVNDVVTEAGVSYMCTLDFVGGPTQRPPLGPWVPTSSVPAAGTGSLKWLQIGGAEFPMGVALVPISILYPLGSGPLSQSDTRKIYTYPAGYLRRTHRDPKAGSTSYLGAAWGLDYPDWKFENRYIITSTAGPIMLRFIADIIEVQRMTPMFCEGLAARMAVEMVEPLTQSTEKLKGISEIYKHFMGEAGTVDGVDRGPSEFPVDDYIQARY